MMFLDHGIIFTPGTCDKARPKRRTNQSDESNSPSMRFISLNSCSETACVIDDKVDAIAPNAPVIASA